MTDQPPNPTKITQPCHVVEKKFGLAPGSLQLNVINHLCPLIEAMMPVSGASDLKQMSTRGLLQRADSYLSGIGLATQVCPPTRLVVEYWTIAFTRETLIEGLGRGSLKFALYVDQHIPKDAKKGDVVYITEDIEAEEPATTSACAAAQAAGSEPPVNNQRL